MQRPSYSASLARPASSLSPGGSCLGSETLPADVCSPTERVCEGPTALLTGGILTVSFGDLTSSVPMHASNRSPQLVEECKKV